MSEFREELRAEPIVRVRIGPAEEQPSILEEGRDQPIKIVVVSDTHMFRMAKALPSALIEELSDGVDLILHAGDWTSPEVYDLLAAYAPVQGVTGNNDGAAIEERWGACRIIEIGGQVIGLTHGHLGRKGTQANALAAFEEDDVDIVVFGHSHIPLSESVFRKSFDRPVLLFNPGSPTDKRRQTRYSYGVITLNGLLVFWNTVISIPRFERSYKRYAWTSQAFRTFAVPESFFGVRFINEALLFRFL